MASFADGLRGLRVWVYFLGCRSNLYESEALAGELAARGAEAAGEPRGCGAAVIVSCSVTAAADRKCRQAVRRARRELEKGGIVAVCGCWAQALDAEEARSLGINILAGNRTKSALPDALEAALPGGFLDMRRGVAHDRSWDSLSLDRPVFRTRAFLKVQEGCDHFCSYCVIPFLRGRPVSRPLADAVAEAGRLAECGEIVLTGIHLGAYRDGDASLAALVRKISEIPGLKRLRLGSLEPFSLIADGGLLDALADSPVFCPHLHLPLQSGDDGVLARMRRGHTADDFLRVCERARDKLGGDLHISSDILTAFPGESEEAHRATLDVMRRAGLGRVHVFPYSPRRGTEAEKFPGRVPPRAASGRTGELLALGGELLGRYASRFVGRELSVLAEDVGKDSLAGYTRNFVFVTARGGGGYEPGREYGVHASERAGGELRGYLT